MLQYVVGKRHGDFTTFYYCFHVNNIITLFIIVHYHICFRKNRAIPANFPSGIRVVMLLAFSGSLHPILPICVITTVGFTEFTLICPSKIEDMLIGKYTSQFFKSSNKSLHKVHNYSTIINYPKCCGVHYTVHYNTKFNLASRHCQTVSSFNTLI